jgi:hypothetical protein
MGAAKDFHEILRDKIDALDERTAESAYETPSNEATQAAYVDPLESFSIHSRSVKFKRQNRSAYKSQHAARADTHTPKSHGVQTPPVKASMPATTKSRQTLRPKEASVAMSKLSASAVITIELLKIDTQKLKTITASQVKTAFRQQAIALHPDLNPHVKPQRFAELKEAVDALLKEIKSMTST